MADLFSSTAPKSSEDPIAFEDAASTISKFLLLYLNPIFTKGYKEALKIEDLGTTANQDKCDVLYNDFLAAWNVERKKPRKNRSLWIVLWKTSGLLRASYAIALYGVYTALSFGPIQILNRLTQYLQGTRSFNTAGLSVLVSLLFILPMAASLFAARSNAIMAHIGLQFRNALITMIYRKSLRLSPSARQSVSTGQIVNMFSNDTAQLQRFLFFMNNVVTAPFQIAVSLALIYLQVGPATFVGLALLVILMPINAIMFGYIGALREKKVAETDKRVKLMNEILSGIRVIKNYAWENAFFKKIESIRGDELAFLKQMAYIIAIGFTIALFAAPTLLPVLIFYTYVRLGNQLDAAKIFTAIALFNLLQLPFTFLPLGLSQYSQSLVSCKRMLDFFDAEELEPYIDRNPDLMASDGLAIKMEDVYANWYHEIEATSQLVKATPESIKQESAARANEKTIRELAGGRRMISINLPSNRGFSALEKEDSDSKEKQHQLEPISEEYVGSEKESPVNRANNTLAGLSVSIKKGSLVAVVGSVGSGKSSFLSALLGELHLKSGSVRVVGSVSYCDQKPWILNATVKDNILFGRPYDELKFTQAIHAASMEDDIRILPAGIMTEIGERGINLSGGQKARVALARAVYCDSDVYLLDDPLSAVDAHVGQHLFQHCIKQVLGDKTRVLVTHHVHLLPHCDLVIILEDGKIKVSGSYEEITNSGIDIESIVPAAKNVASPVTNELVSTRQHVTEDEIEDDEELEGESDVLLEGRSSKSNMSKPRTSSLGAENIVTVDAGDIELQTEIGRIPSGTHILKQSSGLTETKGSNKVAESKKSSKKHEKKGVLMTLEEKKLGDVAPETYSYYIRAGGLHNALIVIIFLCGSQCIQVYSSFWLSDWGRESLIGSLTGQPLSEHRNVWYLNGYAGLACGYLGAFALRSIFLANHRIGTSKGLHTDVLKRVLGAPVAFFDVTPLGRILNRFSSDLLTIDEELSQTISQVTNSVFACLGALGAIAASTKGTFLPLFVPLAYMYGLVQKYFRATNTTIARMESISRSPIYADFSQALTGMSSIRAYQEQDRFVKHLEGMVDRNSIANITSQNASQWLAIRLDFLGSIVTFFIALLAVVTPSGFIPAGYLALGLSYSFQLTTFLKFAVRVLAMLEAQMNSVERLMYYIENIEQEGLKKEVPAENIPRDWPQEGVITGKNIKMRYRDGPLVLKGVDFDIQAHEKIGIAGRTGSGKSSMMIALFRIQELAEGSISIDGIDISTVPLPVLRSRLGIIPQDPVMFSASIRFNLDPFSEHTDQELWDVLDRVRMKDHVLSVPGKLMEEVAEGGDNFSAGQRQLICIARALLRHPKILVLDEATASIDNDTDNIIQIMVREQFKSCTVLTIAHRLNTIIDSDRIMVLETGKLAEFDSAQTLLSKEGGMFKLLWERHQVDHKE